MPYKHDDNRLHKFTKPKYKVTNWPDYNEALRRRGTKRSTTFRLDVPGANCILGLMKSIRYWRANSPRRTSATPRPFRICLAKSQPSSKPSWLMEPTMEYRFLRGFWRSNPTPASSFHHTRQQFVQTQATHSEAYSNHCPGGAHRVAAKNGLQPVQSCGVGHAT